MKLEDAIVQKNFKSEHHKMYLNILYTSNWLIEHTEKHFKPKGITGQQFNILRILRGQHPKPASVNLLKERMLDKMSDTSRLVERLRKKGFVSRKECPDDRRMADVMITPEGLELLKEFDKNEQQRSHFLETLSEQEAKTMNKLLDKLRG